MNNELLERAAELRREAAGIEAQAEAEHLESVKKGGIEAWLGYSFESSSGLTPEFALFARQYKAALKKKMTGFEMLDASRGHFYMSFFFRNISTGKLVYISMSDVRYFSESWYNNLLVRTAEHVKDYTGGRNNFASWTTIRETASELTQ